MAIGATRGFIGSIDCLHPEWKIVNLLSKGNILVMLVNQLRDWKLWHRTLCGLDDTPRVAAGYFSDV
jgi:hypothetical protein